MMDVLDFALADGADREMNIEQVSEVAAQYVPTCDGWCKGANPVAMIGHKGYAYCEPCGLSRRQSGYENVRKLRLAELRKLERGEALTRY